MTILSKSPAQTEEIGRRIGSLLRKGDVVKLYGDLGAGKTTLVKGMARAFGIPADAVISPSFTVMTEYTGSSRLLHIDLYRIVSGSDLESTGIWDSMDEDVVTVIEWPEHAEKELPRDAVSIRMRHAGDEEREITIEGVNEEDWHNL